MSHLLDSVFFTVKSKPVSLNQGRRRNPRVCRGVECALERRHNGPVRAWPGHARAQSWSWEPPLDSGWVEAMVGSFGVDLIRWGTVGDQLVGQGVPFP